MSSTQVVTVIPELSPIQMRSLEAEIERDKGAFLRVGNNLIRIRDGGQKLYQQAGYKTFEEYCAKRWGFSDRHGRRLMAAAQASEKVQAALGTTPATESVAREIEKVADDPRQLEKVNAILVRQKRTIGNATAEQVADAVATVQGKDRHVKHAPKANGDGSHKAKPTPVAETGDIDSLLGFMKVMHKCIEVARDSKAVERRVWEDGLYAHRHAKEIIERLGKPAAPANVKTCKSCGGSLQPGDVMCSNCGEVV